MAIVDALGIGREPAGKGARSGRSDDDESGAEVLEDRGGDGLGVDALRDADGAGESKPEGVDGEAFRRRAVPKEPEELPSRARICLHREEGEGDPPRRLGGEAEEEGLEERVVGPIGHWGVGLERCRVGELLGSSEAGTKAKGRLRGEARGRGARGREGGARARGRERGARRRSMIYFNERYLTISWDAEIGAVRMEWKEFIDGPPFRAGLDAGLALVEQKKSVKWLADLRRLGPVTLEDQKWSNEDWFPRVIAAGLRYMALVSPRKVVAQMSVRTIMAKVMDKNLTTAHFDEVEQARDWLRNAN